MTELWNKLDNDTQPTFELISEYVNSSLWNDLNEHMRQEYKAEPKLEYSGCGMAPGWNVKYRKSGKGLCTLYPESGRFITLVVIGRKEKQPTELLLPALTEYTRNLYAETKEGMDQRWLMLDVRDEGVLADVKQLIAIRRAS